MKYTSEGRHIFDAKGNQVAQCEEYGDAPAIVRACNAHEGLVKALEAQRFVLTVPGTGILPELAKKALAAIDEALAAAKGE